MGGIEPRLALAAAEFLENRETSTSGRVNRRPGIGWHFRSETAIQAPPLPFHRLLTLLEAFGNPENPKKEGKEAPPGQLPLRLEKSIIRV